MLRRSKKRRPWLMMWLASSWLLCGPHLSIAAGTPPNLILIMADDLGARELPIYGNTQRVMPTLDRLAQEGVYFGMAFATPICRASRMEIMTGQYGFRNRVLNNTNRRAGAIDRDAERIQNHLTFAQILQDAGYTTALAGKWALSGRVPRLVVEAGFDEYMMYAFENNLPPGVEHTGGFESSTRPSRYWHPAILKNGEYMPTQPEDYGPDLFTGFIIDFIRRHQEGPFFVYYPMVLPHSPYWPTPASRPTLEERFVRDRANYASMVDYIDVLMSRLVQALEQMELRENTVVIFMSDNGNPFRSSQYGHLGGKGIPNQLGARVPLIVNAPGIVSALGMSRALADATDILPTLADLAGVELPDTTIFDGHSFAPLLRGEPYTPREWIFSYLGDRRILRDQRWLLENNSPHQFGQFFDCGEALNRDECMPVTDTTAPEAMAAKARFEAILADMPAPLLPIHINFQPETSPLPSDTYEDDLDMGEAFTDHSQERIGNQMRSGVSYGWTLDNTGQARDRDLNEDQVLDTLVSFPRRSQWEITLADGDYDVMVILGDPAFSSTHTLNVEGLNYWDAAEVAPNEFLQKEMRVSVTDGLLTLDSSGASDLATRINYIGITPAVPSDAP